MRGSRPALPNATLRRRRSACELDPCGQVARRDRLSAQGARLAEAPSPRPTRSSRQACANATPSPRSRRRNTAACPITPATSPRCRRRSSPAKMLRRRTSCGATVRFGANETVALELAGACRRYTAGLARTMQLGKKPQHVADDTAKAVLEGMDAVLEAVKPGDTRRRCRSRLAQRHRAPRPQEGIAHRLFDRRRLSRRIGASTRSACARATKPCSSPATSSMPFSACGWKAGASKLARPSWSPKQDARRLTKFPARDLRAKPERCPQSPPQLPLTSS